MALTKNFAVGKKEKWEMGKIKPKQTKDGRKNQGMRQVFEQSFKGAAFHPKAGDIGGYQGAAGTA